MKKVLIMALAAFAAACGQQITIEVENTTEIGRHGETVEIAWSDLARLNPSADNLVVSNAAGEEIPSQVLFNGGTEPEALIFQADVDGLGKVQYTVKTGSPAEYKHRAYGRFVPERHDDYAWENDKVAFRAYGPALETAEGEMLVSPGFDAWVKSTEDLVIDLRYERGNYHHDYGDGMDCYKVGRTLGAGASAPLMDGKLWLSRNYASQQMLENGPIRTSVLLTYGEFEVAGRTMEMQKRITLDAGSHFNRIENIYNGKFVNMIVANGFVRHNIKQQSAGDGWLAFVEEASDSKNPAEDGDIYAAVVQPRSIALPDTLGHAVTVSKVQPNAATTYYAATGWSKGGIDSFEKWLEIVEMQSAMVTAPLKVTILE